MRPVKVERALGCAEDRDPPAARVRELDEVADEVCEAVRRTDRVARDDRDAADHLVGNERLLIVVEEVRLVGAQDERGERVGSPRSNEIMGQLTLARLLLVAVTPRRDPREEE